MRRGSRRLCHRTETRRRPTARDGPDGSALSTSDEEHVRDIQTGAAITLLTRDDVIAAVRDALAAHHDEVASCATTETGLDDRTSLARRLRVSVATVDRLRGQGMPELRVCDAPRFVFEDVVVWLRSREA